MVEYLVNSLTALFGYEIQVESIPNYKVLVQSPCNFSQQQLFQEDCRLSVYRIYLFSERIHPFSQNSSNFQEQTVLSFCVCAFTPLTKWRNDLETTLIDKSYYNNLGQTMISIRLCKSKLDKQIQMRLHSTRLKGLQSMSTSD